MGGRGRVALLVVVVLAGCSVWAAQAGAAIYWGSLGTSAISRADLDASSVDGGFVNGIPAPIAVAVDGRYAYWANLTGGIGRANLDGSNPDHALIAASRPTGVAVDGGHIYWTDEDARAVGRANLDGSAADPSFITGMTEPFGVVVDRAHIYWADNVNGRIGRANLDGTGVDQTFITGAGEPNGLAVDAGHIYWTSFGYSRIGRANLDGSGADPAFITDVVNPIGVAVDGRHLYWASTNRYAIGRSNLDGSGVDRAFIAGVTLPTGIAVDGFGVGTASASATSLAFGTQPLATLGAPQSLTVTNTGHGALKIGAARVTSGDADDFLISYDACSGNTLAIGATCTVRVRFAPSAGGDRRAGLSVTSDDSAPALQIALQGTGGELPQGAPGEQGVPGPPGRPGPPGEIRLVICTKTGHHHGHDRERCTTTTIAGPVTFTAARATLSRGGAVRATGSGARGRIVLHARRRLQAGRYTLTLRYRHDGRRVVTRSQVRIRAARG